MLYYCPTCTGEYYVLPVLVIVETAASKAQGHSEKRNRMNTRLMIKTSVDTSGTRSPHLCQLHEKIGQQLLSHPRMERRETREKWVHTLGEYFYKFRARWLQEEKKI